MKRSKLVTKIAKATARSDNEYHGLQLTWADEDHVLYRAGADAALKALAKEFRKWDIIDLGLHDITDELVDFLAGDTTEYVELVER